MFKYKLLINSIIIMFLSASLYSKNITPSDVFMEANALKNAIAAKVTKDAGPSLLPIVDISLEGAKPRHVLSLAIVANKKLGIYMKNNSISGYQGYSIPQGKITPKNVRDLLLVAQSNFGKIASGSGLEKHAVSNKKPSDVMKEIVFLNLWIDKLLNNKVSPSFPYAVLKDIQKLLAVIAERRGVDVEGINPDTYAKIAPRDVFMNAENFYRILSLFESEKFKVPNPKHPYDILSSGTKINPVHVYTLTAFNLNYLYTVAKNLGLDLEKLPESELESGIKPFDVYREYDRAMGMLALIVFNKGV